ncbi:MAG: response regulator [Acidobacteria bacterium]|nr:MAG: response regulator [Acidobacteriota bacterium]
MTEKILFVDDEPNVLAALRRQTRKRFQVETACGAAEALEMLETRGPFAVVVSDLKMPGMNGIELLAEVKKRSPDTVRLMLTGHGDMDATIAAVNKGHIFRFLTKPCPAETLAVMLDQALEQYRLVTAERVLLEQTLNGAVKVLTELLAILNPAAFSRASRIKEYVGQVVRNLGLEGGWRYEMAAMLSQIGCVTLTPETLAKAYAGQGLSPEERESYLKHPVVAHDLLAHIPRLESVARMIRGHLLPPAGATTPEEPEAFGAELLRIASQFEQLVGSGKSAKAAVAELRRRGDFDEKLLEAFEKVEIASIGHVVRTVPLSELRIGMILDQEVKAKNGLLLVAKGQEVTQPLLERLRSFARGVGVVEPMRVLAPAPQPSSPPSRPAAVY